MEVNSVQWTSSPKDHRAPWARVFLDGVDGTLLVRTSRQSGTRRITQMVFSLGAAQESLAQVLKDLPVSRIEFFLRQLPDLPSEVQQWSVDDGDAYATLEVMEDPLGNAIQEEWNRAEKGWMTVRRRTEDEVKRPRLTRPDKSGDDAFYRDVAEAYGEVMARTRAVAPALAEEAGVPVRTVHRWVAEARRRGFLPAASKGRA